MSLQKSFGDGWVFLLRSSCVTKSTGGKERLHGLAIAVVTRGKREAKLVKRVDASRRTWNFQSLTPGGPWE